MSWESSLVYYKLLNLGVEQRLGGLHSARTVMSSVEFHELTELQRAGRWDDVATVLADAARGLDLVRDGVERGGAHQQHVGAGACTARGLTSVGLVGTSYSMQQPFFVDRLASHGLQVVVPELDRHEAIDRIIYGELVHGKVLDASRATVVGVIDDLWDAGAQGVILGCTELELLVKQADCELPVFPSTTLHVEAALDRALAE